LQSPAPVSRDRTTSNVAEPRLGPAEHDVLHVDSPTLSEEAGTAVEGRWPTADWNEHLRIDPKLPLKESAPWRPDRKVGSFGKR